jgi:hypothetical protein
MSPRRRVFLSFLIWATTASLAAERLPGLLYILQSNDFDPTDVSSQPRGRFYHWLGADAVVTHLETGLAVDSLEFAGRGQRIDVRERSPITAVQVKMKRLGRPGELRWRVGSRPGAADLGRGKVVAEAISANYEHFVTLRLPSFRANRLYLWLEAASGRCPDDYYAVYCTWSEAPAEQATINAYDGVRRVPMMYRIIRCDTQGAALESDGREMPQGASMMTRLLTSEPDGDRRLLLADEEEPFAFVDRLVAGEDPRRRGLPWPDLQPMPNELVIDADWRIAVAAPLSPQVKTAIEDLKIFFAQSMKIPLDVIWDESATPRPKTITISQGAGLPGGPSRAAGYRFAARDDALLLHGADARGVLRAVWYLEDLLMLRGGPFVEADDRVREPRYSPRATCAAWAQSGELATPAPVYTDAHLSLISHYGYDAIWLTWYPGSEANRALPTSIPPGRTPEGTTYRPFTARLRDLTERAEKFDLQVVVLYAAPHPATDAERKVLVEEAKTFLAEVPKVNFIVFLDEAMGSSRRAIIAQGANQEAIVSWMNTCRLLAAAFFEVRPEIEIVAWAYNLQSIDQDKEVWNARLDEFARIDPRVGFLSRFDCKWVYRADGKLQYAYDYNISLRAPSVDFRYAVDYLTADARLKGESPRRIWAKIETRLSQESNVQPEIPCLQRWADRFDELNTFASPAISAVFANWSHQGFFPTPVTELFGWMSYTSAPPRDQLLQAIARRDFGFGNENLVMEAWSDFSEAILNYPFYFGLSYPMNCGLAQPFWLDPKATNPRPWRRGFVNSLEQINLAPTEDEIGRSPAFPSGNGLENRARLLKLRDLWSRGLEKLARALAAVPAPVRVRAEETWRNARSFGYAVDSTVRLMHWFDARRRLLEAETAEEKRAAGDELERIGREELQAAREGLPMFLCDSRLGYLNQGRGVFTAQTILHKIEQLEKILNSELPALRARINP